MRANPVIRHELTRLTKNQESYNTYLGAISFRQRCSAIMDDPRFGGMQ